MSLVAHAQMFFCTAVAYVSVAMFGRKITPAEAAGFELGSALGQGFLRHL